MLFKAWEIEGALGLLAQCDTTWLYSKLSQKLGHFLTCLCFLLFHCQAMHVSLKNTGAKRDIEWHLFKTLEDKESERD